MPDEENDKNEKDPIVKQLHGWAALVIAIGGLVAVFVKPEDHTATKAAYQEITKAIEQLNMQNKSDHDDVVALRAYVAMKEGQPLFSAPVPTAPSAGAPARPAKPVTMTVRAPSPAAAALLLAKGPPAPSSMPEDEPPPVHPELAPVHPAAFDAVLKTAK
jgi:hypothetical protein